MNERLLLLSQLTPPPPPVVLNELNHSGSETAVVLCLYRSDVAIVASLIAVLILVLLVTTVRSSKTR